MALTDIMAEATYGARAVTSNFILDPDKMRAILRERRLRNTFFGAMSNEKRWSGIKGSLEPSLDALARAGALLGNPERVRAWEETTPFRQVFSDTFLESIKAMPAWGITPLPEKRVDVLTGDDPTEETGADGILKKEATQAKNPLKATGHRFWVQHNRGTLTSELYGALPLGSDGFATLNLNDALIRDVATVTNNMHVALDAKFWAWCVANIKTTKDNAPLSGINPSTYAGWHNQVVNASDHGGDLFKAVDEALMLVSTEGTADSKFVILAPVGAARVLRGKVVDQIPARRQASPNEPHTGLRDVHGFSLSVHMQAFTAVEGDVPIIPWYNTGSDTSKKVFIVDLSRLHFQIGVTNESAMLPGFGHGYAVGESAKYQAVETRLQSMAWLCPDTKRHTAVVVYS